MTDVLRHGIAVAGQTLDASPRDSACSPSVAVNRLNVSNRECRPASVSCRRCQQVNRPYNYFLPRSIDCAALSQVCTTCGVLEEAENEMRRLRSLLALRRWRGEIDDDAICELEATYFSKTRADPADALIWVIKALIDIAETPRRTSENRENDDDA